MDGERIRHTVVFRLKHEPNSEGEKSFLADAVRILPSIPGVEHFEALRQVSAKNQYSFGFSMEFANQSAYDAYNGHPQHVQFVEQRWQTEVLEFMEIDYQAI